MPTSLPSTRDKVIAAWLSIYQRLSYGTVASENINTCQRQFDKGQWDDGLVKRHWTLSSGVNTIGAVGDGVDVMGVESGGRG